jgi:hypothetical protein
VLYIFNPFIGTLNSLRRVIMTTKIQIGRNDRGFSDCMFEAQFTYLKAQSYSIIYGLHQERVAVIGVGTFGY